MFIHGRKQNGLIERRTAIFDDEPHCRIVYIFSYEDDLTWFDDYWSGETKTFQPNIQNVDSPNKYRQSECYVHSKWMRQTIESKSFPLVVKCHIQGG